MTINSAPKAVIAPVKLASALRSLAIGDARGQQSSSSATSTTDIPSAERNPLFFSEFGAEGQVCYDDGVKFNFESPAEFARIYEEAVKIDHQKEEDAVRKFNDEEKMFDAWLEGYMPSSNNCVFRLHVVNVDVELPEIGQTWNISLTWVDEDSSDSSSESDDGQGFGYSQTCTRVDWCSGLSSDVYFAVRMCLSETTRKRLERQPGQRHSRDALVQAKLHLFLSATTRVAEETALEVFKKSDRFKFSREYFTTFTSPSKHVNLFDTFPHMCPPHICPDISTPVSPKCARIKQLLLDALDGHQLDALEGLSEIPEHLYILPGGPGSGKSRWCLSFLALAQASERKVRAFFLLDINEPLTDTAMKMVKMQRDLGLGTTAIRWHRWSKWLEMNGITLGRYTGEEKECQLEVANLILRKMENSQENNLRRNGGDDWDPPTLDDIAWEIYFSDEERYSHIKDTVTVWKAYKARLASRHGSATTENHGLSEFDLQCFRDELCELYRTALDRVDTIFATPVAAQLTLPGVFKPDLIIFDESGHAREPATLMSLVHFSPEA